MDFRFLAKYATCIRVLTISISVFLLISGRLRSRRKGNHYTLSFEDKRRKKIILTFSVAENRNPVGPLNNELPAPEVGKSDVEEVFLDGIVAGVTAELTPNLKPASWSDFEGRASDVTNWKPDAFEEESEASGELPNLNPAFGSVAPEGVDDSEAPNLKPTV